MIPIEEFNRDRLRQSVEYVESLGYNVTETKDKGFFVGFNSQLPWRGLLIGPQGGIYTMTDYEYEKYMEEYGSK